VVNKDARLDISIGPVQGFVARSRRTRDLWASSFLLSYLAGTAFAAAERVGAILVHPRLEGDPLYQWIVKGATGQMPRIGSIPNHAKFRIDAVQGESVAKAAEAAFWEEWRRICKAVRERLLPDDVMGLGAGVDAIWRRQTERFWEFVWTIAQTQDDDGPFARRKLWRTHIPPAEPGDKCMVMSDLQELSGRVRAQGAEAREAQDKFWKAVREKAGGLVLRPDERLSAVALVKRFFPDVTEQLFKGQLDVARWPSTLDVAAFPWVQKAAAEQPDLAAEYARLVRRHAGSDAFRAPYPAPLKLNWASAALDGFDCLSANYFYLEWLESDGGGGGGEYGESSREGRLSREKIAAHLHFLCEKVGRPSPFYALVLADGDRMGELLRTEGEQKVSEALGRFARRIPDIALKRSAVVVYAGGDDVLAMAPAVSALRFADDLAEAYREAHEMRERATLSASVLFVDGRVPLSTALQTARTLLLDVAKELNGRDSLAVGLLKRGGMTALWRTTWVRSCANGARAVEAIEELSELLQGIGTERLSSSLLYRIRGTLGLLCGWPSWRPGEAGRLGAAVELSVFLRADVAASLERIRRDGKTEEGKGESDHYVRALKRLLPLCSKPDIETNDAGVPIMLDALFIADFLANEARGVYAP
jgi:CRISPR-associated protein Cmr2